MCPSGEIAAGARGLWAGLVSNCIAIFIVCTCQFLMAVDKASNLALTEIDEAFKGEREAFNLFLHTRILPMPWAPLVGILVLVQGTMAAQRSSHACGRLLGRAACMMK